MVGSCVLENVVIYFIHHMCKETPFSAIFHYDDSHLLFVVFTDKKKFWVYFWVFPDFDVFLDTLYKDRELGVLYVWVCLLWKERFYHVDDVWKCQSKFAILLLIFHLSFITFSVRVWKQDDTRMEDIIKYCNTLGNLMIVYGGVKIGNSPCRPFYTYRVIWTRLFAYKCDCRKIK